MAASAVAACTLTCGLNAWQTTHRMASGMLSISHTPQAHDSESDAEPPRELLEEPLDSTYALEEAAAGAAADARGADGVAHTSHATPISAPVGLMNVQC